MGWLTTGFCGLIAGYIIYRFVSKGDVEDTSKLLASPSLNGSLNYPLKEVKGDLPIPEITCENDDIEPTTQLASPPMELSMLKEDILSAKKMEDTNPASGVQPKISMPPPTAPPNLSQPSIPPRLKPPSFANSSAPPRPGNGFVQPPPSAAASLRVPQTKPLPGASLAPTSSIMPPGKQVSRKVILEPGHSPLDWAALTSNPRSRLRGKDAPGENLVRVTPAQLKRQTGRKGKDAWTVYQGKVYNITPYISFHPGGAGEIMRGAGRDSDKLFMEVHPWVNWDAMLSECLIGILVSEEEGNGSTSGSLDDMD